MNLKFTKFQPDLKGKKIGNILPSKLQIIGTGLLLICFCLLPFKGQGFDFSDLSTKKRKDNFFQRTFVTLKATIAKNLLENETAVVSMNMALMPETISGVIFRDFQNDGTIGIDDQRFDADELPSQIIITAYDAGDAIVGVTNPNAAGSWTLNVTLPVRLEITNLPTGYQATKVGSGHINTVTQIRTAGSNYNFGMNHIADFVESNPRLVAGCLALGNNETIVSSWEYNVRTPSSNGRRNPTGGTQVHTTDILKAQMGHVWGVANHSQSNQIFFSALNGGGAWTTGPLGIDGIYKADYSGSNKSFLGVTPFLDLSTIGVDISGDGTRFGQSGLGGMDISEDEETLYIVNVGAKEIVVLNIGAGIVAPSTYTAIPITDPGCQGGQWRPYALEQRRDKLYVGGVCDGSSSNSSNLELYILEYDLNNPSAGWVSILNEPLDWNIGGIRLGGTSPWAIWDNADSFTTPEPAFVDMAFDIDGSIILAFMPRWRFHGQQEEPPGHFLRAHKDGSGYTLEENDVSGPYTSNGFNSEGLSNSGRRTGGRDGEAELFFSQSCCGHGALGAGGVAVVNGSKEVLTGQADPIGWFTFGVVYHDALDGSGDFGHVLGNVKSALVTDIGVISDLSTIDIGNFVWIDDGDGVQEADEDPIVGLTVQLYTKPSDGSNPILAATTTTNSNGEYYFSSTLDTDEIWTNGMTEVLKDSSYYIVFAGDNYDTNTNSITLNGENFNITTNDNAAGVNADEIDSDATEINLPTVGKFPAICVTPSETNYSHDIGFVPACKIELSYTQLACSETSTGVFEATFDVSIIYENAPDPAENIIFDFNGTSQNITTLANGADTAMVQITVTADGSSVHQIFAHFATDTACADTLTFKAPVPCPADIALDCSNVVSGTAYQDANYDGTNNDNVGGIEGVKVLAYDCNNNLVDSTWTDADGEYQLPNTITGVEYRIEFVLSAGILCDYKPTIIGSANNSTIQFAQAGTCVDLGLTNPSNYCEENPLIMVSCYVNGARTSGGPSDVIVGFDYNNSNTNNPTGKKTFATKSQIGSVWGLAYSKSREMIYSATFLKRNIDLGPNGLGAVYQSSINGTANGSLLINIPNAGTAPINRGLGAFNGASADADAFAKVGKVGLGDIDISEDEKYLYVTNLNDKNLYVIDIDAGTLVTSVAIPDPGCNNGEFRPFATKYKAGKVYVGGLCDGSVDGASGTSNANMTAYVYVMDASTNTFSASEVLNFPLTYGKEEAWGMAPASTTSRRWYPWDDVYNNDFSSFGIDSRRAICHPVPMLTDIEFTNDNRMILGFADRTGHQFNDQNRLPNSGQLVALIAGGDIVQANPTGQDQWTIETLSVGVEFFNGDDFSAHLETSHGGVSFIAPKNEITLSAMDPYRFTSGGVVFISTDDGEQTKTGVELYVGNASSGYSGKGVGLGDMETLCEPAPIEIGNYVWIDEDADGIQDACEPALDSIQIRLYDANCNLIGLDTTLNNGLYAFNQNNVDTTGVSATGAATTGFSGLSPNTTYYVVLGTDGQWNATDNQLIVGTNIYELTLTNQGNNDHIDNDASAGNACSLPNDAPFIEIQTATAGCMIHNADFGLLAGLSLGNLVWEDLNNNGLVDTLEPGIDSVALALYTLGPDGVKGGNDDVLVDSTLTDAMGNYTFTALDSGTYYVKIVGGIPTGMVSATGTGADGTQANTFEPFIGTDNNVNNNDDGTQMLMADGTLMIMSDTIVLKEMDEPIDDEDTNNNSNLTVDFGLINLLSVGDLVWEDENNDGLNNNNEVGIDGVELIIFDPVDGTKGNGDDLALDTVLTTNGGQYLFDSLYPGEYYIKLNNGIPAGFVSSTASANDTLNTEPAIDPDSTDLNNDDNGTQMGTMVMSDLVLLSLSDEPINDGDADSTSNLAVDFGLFVPLSIGNLVWEDLNNNGLVDNGEPGIDSVEIILFEVGSDGLKDGGDDIAVDTLLTDNSGNYLFDTLGTGTYYVKINSGIPANMYSSTGVGADGSQPVSYEPGAMTDGDVNGDDDGTQMGNMIMSDTLYLNKFTEPTNDGDVDSTSNLSVDFGLIRYLSIGNLVWEDGNNDGLFNNGEQGIDSIEVILFQTGIDGEKGTNDDVGVDTMLTLVDGSYLFDSLAPGEYYVKLNSGFITGMISSTGEGTPIINGTGTYEPGINADTDATNDDDNGTQMGGGTTLMIMSDTVNLTLSNEPINDGDADSTSNLAVDFGIVQTMSVGNLVWEDLNNNGMVDIGESGIDSVEVILFELGVDGVKGTGDDVEIKRDTTDGTGHYLFEMVTSGLYYIKLNDGIPTNMYSATGTGADGSNANTSEPFIGTDLNVNDNDDGTQMITGNQLMIMSDTFRMMANTEPITDGDTDINTNLSIDFGLIRLLSIGNLVWEDNDNDGLNNNGETGIDGIEVLLISDGGDGIKGNANDTILDSMLTANGGLYLFDSLYPGDYFIKLNDGIPAGMHSSTGEGTGIFTGSGAAEPAADPDATDTNDDDSGTQMGTPTMRMVMSDLVTLSLSDEPITDGDVDTTSNLAVDFGLYQTISVGNLVWEDLNNDGDFDSGTESGIDSVEVEIYNIGPDGIKGTADDTLVQTDTTDANGHYNFTFLGQGTYFVKLSDGIPTGYVSANGAGTTGTNAPIFEPGAATDGDTNNDDDGTQMGMMVMSDTFQLMKNMEPVNDSDLDANTNFSVDFGLIPSMSLGNLVWEDLDNSGTVDAGEPGIDGVEVLLLTAGPDGIKGNADDVALDSILTSAGGSYLFDTLYPGEYYVKLNDGIPMDFISSSGEGDAIAFGTGTYETAPDPDVAEVNNDDNGTQMGAMVMSDLVLMELYNEPINDDDTDNTTNYNVDFGLYHTLTIGNLVWEDFDNNGLFDSGTESGMDSVEVVLYQPGADGIKGNADDVEIARDTTNANGNYLFEDLYPNNYYLVLENGIPANMVSSTGEGDMVAAGTGAYETAPDPDTNINSDDDGTGMQVGNNMLIMSDILSLGLYDEPINDGDANSTTNLSVDFGLFETMSIGNLVWEDLNNDGVADASEPKMENIIVTLFKDGGDGIKMSADDINMGNDTTDSNGNYLFDNLYPGNYYLKINDLPFGMISSTGEGINSTSNSGTYEPAPDADVDTDNLDDGIFMDSMIMSTMVSLHLYDEPVNDSDTENNTNLSVDFGLFQTLILGNLVWEDLNNNGIVDSNEPGMEGIEVILYRDYDGIKGGNDDVEIGRDTTDAAGQYLFLNLDAGMYYVKLNSGIPSGFMSSTGEGTAFITGTGAYEPAPDPDVYMDMDDNGTQMTMPDGTIMVMSDLISMVLYNEQTDSVINIDVDFGLYNTLEAGNLVWEDRNNNGVVDAGEPGIQGVEVILYQTTNGTKGDGDDVEIGRDTTDNMGLYIFQTLEPGDYWVKLNSGIPTGFYSSTGEGINTVTGTGTFEPSSMLDDNIDDNDDGTQMGTGGNIMVMSDIVSLDLYDEPDNDGTSDSTANYRIDFGLYETIDLGNLVWEDYDNDGMKDVGEPGFPNIEVVLSQPGPDGLACTADDILVDKDTTDATGAYLFDYLYPNEYFITLNNIPTGFFSSSGEGFTNAGGTGVNEPAADPDTDVNNDDDGTEAYLADGTRIVKSGIFDLALYTESTNDDDTDNTTNYTVDFGLYESLEIGNLVWEDLNNNGLVDAGEPGFDNIEVMLYKAGPDGQKGTGDDIEIGKDTTDSNGHYQFVDLYPGDYFVKLNSGIPAHYASSTGEGVVLADGSGIFEPAADPDGNINNDDDGTQMGNPDGSLMITSDLVSLHLYEEPINDGDIDSTTNFDIDFGIIPLLSIGNMVWEDLNNNGLMDSGEPAIAGVETILYKDGGDGQANSVDDLEIGRIITDSLGKYQYDDLYPGDYFIKLANGIPYNMVSATGEGVNLITGTGAYETAPDQDVTNSNVDDNGTQLGIEISSDLVSLQLYDEPIDDDDTNEQTNTAVDFGLIRKLDLGGFIWFDRTNDGDIGIGEDPLSAIEVVLYKVGPDGIIGTPDDQPLDTVMTNGNGEYLFTSLFPDDYYVLLQNVPTYLASSDGNGFGAYTGNGPLENGGMPDDLDFDDNGIQVDQTTVTSEILDLNLYSEPIDDDDVLNYTNTTIDFALTPLHFARIFDPCNCLANESAPGAGDGQFEETIIILSTVPNQTWNLVANTGMFTTTSIPVPLGTTAIPNGQEDGFYKYELRIRHVDNQGYSATFESTNGVLTVANFCQYEASCLFELATSPDGTPGAPVVSNAQNFILGVTNTPKSDTLLACDNNSDFMDDGLVDGLYIDTTARDNQYTICPQNQWQHLQANFTQFGLAPGDVLFVHDGKNISAPLIGEYRGEGVSQTGGWVAAHCDPDTNATGCLTFRFVTNGDNNKSIGWQADIVCNERNIQLTPPNDLHVKLDCDSTYAIFNIQPTTVMAGCGTVQDSQIVRVFNQHGIVCLDTCLAITDVMRDTFAIGSYLIEYKLKSDTFKTAQAVMTVQGPSLVCNDEINVPLGSACSIVLTPDDLLETACDTIIDTIYYFITLKGIDKNGQPTVLATGGGKGGNYPNVTKDMIDQCGGTITAEIEKQYYDGLNLTFCNNGPQNVSCAVTVNLFDQVPPVFTNISTVADTFRLCSVDLTADALGLPTPTAIDNCDTATVEFVDATILDDGGTCDTTRATLNWKATDACGNETTLAQSVVILRPEFTDIITATNVLLSCGEDSESTLNDFAKTGVPSIKVGKVVNGVLIPTDTIALDTADYVCGYIIQKTDVNVAANCGIKLFRYWEVLDWCDSQSGVKHISTQLIEWRDTLAPTFVDNALPTRIIDLPHFACALDITALDNPVATDNCSNVSVSMDAVFRIENGTNSPIEASEMTALDCDSFLVQWVAEDACPQQIINDTITQLILIEDNTAPSAACVDKINLSLGQNDATLHFRDIDGGSFDACGIVTYEVSRDEVNWDATVTFDCNDAHAEATVYLRVTDGKGNQSTCWMTVNVEDKIAPICSDLPDMTGTCDELHLADLGASTDINDNGLLDDEWVDLTEEQIDLFNAKYGNPNCADNLACGALIIQQQYQLAAKECGRAAIQRRFRAIDWDGEGRTSNWFTQNINIESTENWAVTLPADWKGTCGDNVPSSGLTIANGACDLIAYEVAEKEFTITEDACLKVVRTFTIINWCNYEAGQAATQITRTENEHGMVTESRIISSTEFENVGKLEYIQILKVQDDTAPVITIGSVDNCIESTDCKATKRFAVTANDCNTAATIDLAYNWTISTSGTQLATGEGSFFEFEVAPKVSYEVEWSVADNCGNIGKASENYEFLDCQKPTPYCLNGVAVELMQDVGMIQVWAKDLERSSADNCTTTDRLAFKIWHASLGEAPTDLARVQALPAVLTFDCATLGEQTVNLYVIDEAGNFDFCITSVIVQDNRNVCENIVAERMAVISGTIMDWKQQTVEDVQVSTSTSTSTQADGQYYFELAMNNRYTVEAAKNEHPLNGVSTFDLVLISKHILGITEFDNPYQMIAADVNKSGSITAFDMVQLRQMILNIKTEFTNNKSWRFVDAAYEFTTDQPLAENFPEVIQIENLEQDMEMDFVAVKVGDVNANARTNSLSQAEDRTTTNTFEITTEDKVLKAGETYNLAFSTEQLNTIQGYQFTLGYDNLKLEKLNSGVVGVENFGLHKMDDGWITTSWNQASVGSQQLAVGSRQPSIILFNIDFTALKDGKLSEQLSIINRPTTIEAYDKNDNLMDVQLTFTTPLSDNQFELFQNQPNPFHDRTIIGFYLPGDAEIELVLRDETGRILKTFKEARKGGYNTIQLEEELTNGFIYYQLSTKFGTKAKKMLQLK